MGANLTKSNSKILLAHTDEQPIHGEDSLKTSKILSDDKNKNPKKKTKSPTKFNKNSSKMKIDQSTNTDNYFLMLSSGEEKSIDQSSIKNIANQNENDISSVLINQAYQSETGSNKLPSINKSFDVKTANITDFDPEQKDMADRNANQSSHLSYEDDEKINNLTQEKLNID